MAEKIKDNSNRCPWCGNFLEKSRRYNLKNWLKCPFCGHHYRYMDVGRTVILTLPAVIFLSVFFNIWVVVFAAYVIDIIILHFEWSSDPMIRCIDTIMPTKGFRAEINLFQKQSRQQLKSDIVIPIVFIDGNGKAVSSLCCVRIENGKWRHGTLKCDLRLLTFGDQPQEITDKIYLYNKGKIIAAGSIICELDSGY
ncbi:MAG: hypothetical protein J1E40_01185 [Oscillospiraceae bacterium]|nr:hypothetical protein [Oscillospiraceae bacterium]